MLNGAEGACGLLTFEGFLDFSELPFSHLYNAGNLIGLLGGFNGIMQGQCLAWETEMNRQVESHVKSYITHVICLALSPP